MSSGNIARSEPKITPGRWFAAGEFHKGDICTTAWAKGASHRRVSIIAGELSLYLTQAQAVALADAVIDAIEETRAANRAVGK